MKDFYTVHDFFSVQVSSEEESIRRGYAHYFRCFKTTKETFEGRRYHIRDFSDFVLPRAYRKDGPYIGFSSGFSIPREQYAVVLRGGCLEEYVTYANRATNLWVQTMLVPQEMSLVHGAGVSLDNKGILFAGFGGVGKTLLVAELRKRDGCKFFGDDYVMIDGESAMYAYPTDFSLYPYHRNAFQDLKGTRFFHDLTRRQFLHSWYTFQRAVNFASRRITKYGRPIFQGWNASYIKVPAETLVLKERIGIREQLYACVFLSRCPGTESMLDEISVEESIALLEGNLQIEYMHAFPYLSLLHAYGVFDAVGFFVRQRSVLQKCFRSIKRFRLSIPMNTDTRAIAKTITQHFPQIL